MFLCTVREAWGSTQVLGASTDGIQRRCTSVPRNGRAATNKRGNEATPGNLIEDAKKGKVRRFRCVGRCVGGGSQLDRGANVLFPRIGSFIIRTCDDLWSSSKGSNRRGLQPLPEPSYCQKLWLEPQLRAPPHLPPCRRQKNLEWCRPPLVQQRHASRLVDGCLRGCWSARLANATLRR